MTFSAYIKAKLIAYVDVARTEKLSLLLSQKINCMNYEEKKKGKLKSQIFFYLFSFFLSLMDLISNTMQGNPNPTMLKVFC